ncbi:hypothetical protein KIN20_032328 [Parelaphostrongylus tenuis]|uniref:Uncharacterized protein n=1 Tax=Parelaphostrongylus tenuis TaxID=148309 RepID=A0AAD5R6W5_PARTN|nr:hypothetical protein KIN20_032328 [Parelaphostrongylus tenuis]
MRKTTPCRRRSQGRFGSSDLPRGRRRRFLKSDVFGAGSGPVPSRKLTARLRLRVIPDRPPHPRATRAARGEAAARCWGFKKRSFAVFYVDMPRNRSRTATQAFRNRNDTLATRQQPRRRRARAKMKPPTAVEAAAAMEIDSRCRTHSVWNAVVPFNTR